MNKLFSYFLISFFVSGGKGIFRGVPAPGTGKVIELGPGVPYSRPPHYYLSCTFFAAFFRLVAKNKNVF